MIIADFTFSDDDTITAFTISGHAEFDEEGKDIVCSAVTALAFSTINSIESLLSVKAKLDMADSEGGYLKADYTDNKDSQEVQLLLHHLLIGLTSIEETYSDYIKLRQTR